VAFQGTEEGARPRKNLPSHIVHDTRGKNQQAAGPQALAKAVPERLGIHHTLLNCLPSTSPPTQVSFRMILNTTDISGSAEPIKDKMLIKELLCHLEVTKNQQLEGFMHTHVKDIQIFIMNE